MAVTIGMFWKRPFSERGVMLDESISNRDRARGTDPHACRIRRAARRLALAASLSFAVLAAQGSEIGDWRALADGDCDAFLGYARKYPDGKLLALLRARAEGCPEVLAALDGKLLPGMLPTAVELQRTKPFEPAMVALPAGAFQMGSPPTEAERLDNEGPRHLVMIRPFAIGRTEVTFDEFDAFCEDTGRQKPDDSGWGRGDRPVIDVSWEDAAAYLAWLGEQTDRPYRLPTEAEWEYAARAGTETPFWSGRCIHTDQANYDGRQDYAGCGAATGLVRRRTVSAGALPPNAFGLHEVAGNVWEWVQDCFDASYRGAAGDGRAQAPAGCERRVFRGGSWNARPQACRSAHRLGDWQYNRYNFVGFRAAMDLEPAQPLDAASRE
jgi:formylglycine-generating enzyme required for sulfatase activity